MGEWQGGHRTPEAEGGDGLQRPPLAVVLWGLLPGLPSGPPSLRLCVENGNVQSAAIPQAGVHQGLSKALVVYQTKSPKMSFQEKYLFFELGHEERE